MKDWIIIYHDGVGLAIKTVKYRNIMDVVCFCCIDPDTIISISCANTGVPVI